MEFFNMDNPVFRLLGRLTDLVWLNILTLICCIPIVTAGAAFSAMYKVLLHMTLKEEGVVTRPFFRSFKENLRQATIIWIPSLFIMAVLGANAWLIYQGVMDAYGPLKLAAGISIGLVFLLLIMFLHYYFALTARYNNTWKQTMSNAFLLLFGYFPRSLCILVISAFPLALMKLSLAFYYFWIVYGFTFPGYVSAMLLGDIFVKTERRTCEPEMEEEERDDLEVVLEEEVK